METRPNVMTEDCFRQHVQSLNSVQKRIFDHVQDWAWKKSTGMQPDPMNLFVTGGAGTGRGIYFSELRYLRL